MATFSELRTDLRDEILVEDDTGFYSDSGLLDYLVDASIELAAAGAFPTAVSTSTLSSGSGSLSAPSDILRVDAINAGGFDVSPASVSEVRLYQKIDGEPRYYYWDEKRGGSVLFGPQAGSSTSVTIEYVKDLTDTSYSASDTPWDGQMPQFHDVIKYYAAVKAFEQGFEYEKSQYWQQRFQSRLQAFSAFLGNASILELVRRPQEAES